MRIPILILLVLLSACGGSESVDTVPATVAVATTVVTTTTLPPTTTTTVAPTTTTTIFEIAEAPAGFYRFAVPGTGLTIVAPESFLTIDLGTNDVEAIFEEAEGVMDDEQLSSMLDSIDPDVFLFWAFDFENASVDFVPNINALAFDRGPFDSPEIYQEVLEEVYASFGATLTNAFILDDERSVISEGSVEAGGIGSLVYQLTVFGEEQVFSVTYSAPIDADQTYVDAIRDAMLLYSLEESVTYE